MPLPIGPPRRGRLLRLPRQRCPPVAVANGPYARPLRREARKLQRIRCTCARAAVAYTERALSQSQCSEIALACADDNGFGARQIDDSGRFDPARAGIEDEVDQVIEPGADVVDVVQWQFIAR